MAREVLTDDKCDALISHVITCSSVEHIDQTRRFVREWAAGLVPAASAEQSEREATQLLRLCCERNYELPEAWGQEQIDALNNRVRAWYESLPAPPPVGGEANGG